MTHPPPPFAVPRGMQWDPEKRRFFKAPPHVAAIKVDVAGKLEQKNRQNERQEVQRHVAVAQGRDRRVVGMHHGQYGARSGHTLSAPLLRGPQAGGRLMSSDVRAFSSHLAFDILSRLRLHTVASAAPQIIVDAEESRSADEHSLDDRDGIESLEQESRNLDLQSLDANSMLGSCLFFTTSAGFMCFIDLARISPRSNCPTHVATTDFPVRQSAEAVWRQLRNHDRPFGAVEASLYHPSLAGYGLHATALSNDGRHIVELCDDASICLHTLCVSDAGQRAFSIVSHKLPRKHPCALQNSDEVHITAHCSQGGWENVNRGEVESRIIIVVTVGRGASIWSVDQWRDAEEPHSVSAASVKLKSDILCHDVIIGGCHALLGCRNGDLYLCDTSHTEADVKISGCSAIPATKPKLVLTYVSGAVTNIKCISETAALVAYSSGMLRMISLHDFSTIMKYRGHENSWTLHPPLAIDLHLRIFALAGQDKRVRLWSFDRPDPLPLQTGSSFKSRIGISTDGRSAADDNDRLNLVPHMNETHPLRGKMNGRLATSLADAVFYRDIRGLAFIPREHVRHAEGRQNTSFLARGVPALAVTCASNLVFIFE